MELKKEIQLYELQKVGWFHVGLLQVFLGEAADVSITVQSEKTTTLKPQSYNVKL